MSSQLVTPIDEPTLCMIFNERKGAELVAEAIERQHAFVEFEAFDTTDEQGRSAVLLLIRCETATAQELFELIGHRLPDYIQARWFPPSRVASVISSVEAST